MGSTSKGASAIFLLLMMCSCGGGAAPIVNQGAPPEADGQGNEPAYDTRMIGTWEFLYDISDAQVEFPKEAFSLVIEVDGDTLSVTIPVELGAVAGDPGGFHTDRVAQFESEIHSNKEWRVNSGDYTLVSDKMHPAYELRYHPWDEKMEYFLELRVSVPWESDPSHFWSARYFGFRTPQEEDDMARPEEWPL